MSDDLELFQVNTTAAREHVGKIERGIRVAKERSRGVITNLSFASFYKIIVIHLIYFVLLWLNYFLSTQGISEKHPPIEIVTI